MDKHMPGPWVAKEGWSGYVLTADGEYVGKCDGESDAMLASAAPEMLEALRKHFENFGATIRGASPPHHELKLAQQTREAIEKATGGRS